MATSRSGIEPHGNRCGSRGAQAPFVASRRSTNPQKPTPWPPRRPGSSLFATRDPLSPFRRSLALWSTFYCTCRCRFVVFVLYLSVSFCNYVLWVLVFFKWNNDFFYWVLSWCCYFNFYRLKLSCKWSIDGCDYVLWIEVIW